MYRFILLLATICLFPGFLSSQQSSLPADPEPGKCYVKCITPDIYETQEKKIMIKPAHKILITEPPEYKTVEETMMIKPASKKFIYHPAEFETYYEDIRVEEPYNKLSIIPASFKDSQEKLEVEPKTGRWEYREYEDCESDNPADCRMLCWVEYDPIFETVNTKVLDQDARTNGTPVGGKMKKIKKQRIKKEAWVEEIEIPAEYGTVKMRKLVSDESTRETMVEAEYKTIRAEVLAKKGGVSVWEEVACELTEYNLLPIYYELNSARLTQNSKKIIDEKLYSLMKDKSLIRIELNSHTDSRGTAVDNMDLSERRARSVVDYLISKGINSSRLVAKGYGESRLVNRCSDSVSCTEKEHQQNRRTEFRILGG